MRNLDGKEFEDISTALKPIGAAAVSLMARWLDLDQDGEINEQEFFAILTDDA